MHEDLMRRALDLARAPASTSPNPRVGAVIVADGEVVGEGAHEGSGTLHAEAIALRAAGDKALGASIYVTLEPCAHQGRMPPCAPALVEAGIARVWAALEDPDERVRGRGFALLREHGIDVEVGLLAEEAEEVNRTFLHHRRTGRPYVSLKLALTIDGRLAAPDGSSRWITGEGARRIVHARRAEVDAVLVGSGTAIADDPQLTARDVPGARQPARVVVDGAGRVPPWSRVFDDGHVVVATTADCPSEAQVSWKDAGAEVVVLPAGDRGMDLAALLDHMGDRGWIEVLCEGGAELGTSLLRGDLVDRLEIHTGPRLVGRGGPDIGDLGIGDMSGAMDWSLVSVDRFEDDVVTIYDRRRS